MNNLDKGRTYAKTSGGFYDRYHVWNALKVFPFDNNVYRDRVETIIIRGNKDVFVKKRPDGKYFLPGGSKEKNISDIEQAENECKEEARIIISNIEPTGITIKKVNDPSDNNDKYIWNGSVTDIYVAQYESVYKGKIDNVDKEQYIISGKFYPVKNCLKFFNDEHREALIWYLKNHVGKNDIMTESVYKDGINKFIHNNIKSPEDLLKWMKSNVKYSNYTNLMSAEEVYEQKKGSCHDQSNFVFYVFNKLHLKKGRIFIIEYNEKNGQGGETHSFTYYMKKGKYYWFESAWGSKIGIHGPYDSMTDMKKAVNDAWNKKAAFPDLYITNVKGVKEGMDLQEFVDSCCNDDYVKESSLQHDVKVYFISEKNMSGELLKPRIPSNYFTQNNYEDKTTPRICFSSSIDGALMGLSKNLKGKKLFIHTPISNIDAYKPTTEQVPDCKITKELWYTKPVKIKCIGVINVIKAKNKNGHKFTYGKDKSAELYEWDWEWDLKFDNKKIIPIKDDEDDYAGVYVPQRISEIRREIETKMDVTEAALTSSDRKKLKDSDFGIPKLRKYPLIDAQHVKSAIRFFNQAPSEYERELAINIFNAMRKFNIPRSTIGDKNKLQSYASVYLKDENKYNKYDIDGFLTEYISTVRSMMTNIHKVLKFWGSHTYAIKSGEDKRYIDTYTNMMVSDYKLSVKLFNKLKDSDIEESFEKKKSTLYELKYNIETEFKSSKNIVNMYDRLSNDERRSDDINLEIKHEKMESIKSTIIKGTINNINELLKKC